MKKTRILLAATSGGHLTEGLALFGNLPGTELILFTEYTPRMKKLTYSQGKLLIKLIDRETHSSGYELINAFLGPVRAGFYQAFAWVFGASLKKRYDPMGADRLTERIVLQVEAGQL